MLTLSVQKSQMSLPPMNMVITFQSLWKSRRCKEGKREMLGVLYEIT